MENIGILQGATQHGRREGAGDRRQATGARRVRTDTIAFQTFRKLGATRGAVEPLRADVEKPCGPGQNSSPKPVLDDCRHRSCRGRSSRLAKAALIVVGGKITL